MSSSFPDLSTLGDTSSSFPEHSTLGFVKCCISIRVWVGLSFGFFFTFRLAIYSETAIYVSNIHKAEKYK